MVAPIIGAPIVWILNGQMGRVALAILALSWMAVVAVPRAKGRPKHPRAVPVTVALLLVVTGAGLPHLTSPARVTASAGNVNTWRARSSFGR